MVLKPSLILSRKLGPHGSPLRKSYNRELPHNLDPYIRSLCMMYGARANRKRDFEAYDGGASREERKKSTVRHPVPLGTVSCTDILSSRMATIRTTMAQSPRRHTRRLRSRHQDRIILKSLSAPTIPFPPILAQRMEKQETLHHSRPYTMNRP